MSIKASEISDLIGQRIQNFAGGTEARNVGVRWSDFGTVAAQEIAALVLAAAALAAVMKATNALLKLSGVGANVAAGNYVNETADAAW